MKIIYMLVLVLLPVSFAYEPMDYIDNSLDFIRHNLHVFDEDGDIDEISYDLVDVFDNGRIIILFYDINERGVTDHMARIGVVLRADTAQVLGLV